MTRGSFGGAIFLIALGAILRYAVTAERMESTSVTVGLILMIAGGVMFALTLVFMFSASVEKRPLRLRTRRRLMVEEARLEQQDAGFTAVTDGWFVVNVRDAPWVTSEGLSDACIFEGDEAPFLRSGSRQLPSAREPSGLYHREANQENFLVLSGECMLLVEGEERHLRAWDFVHCPPGTDHIIVGAGDGPRLVFMTGARGLAREGHRLPPLGGSPPPRCRRGRGDDGSFRGLRVAAEVAAGRPKDWNGLPWA